MISEAFFGFEPFMNEGQKRRFRQHVEDLLYATAEDIDFLKSNEIGCLERFIECRLKTGFFEFYVFLAEVCCGLDIYNHKEKVLFKWVLFLLKTICSLTQRWLKSFPLLFRKTIRSLVILLTLTNDFYSFNKEVADGTLANTVYMIQKETKCSSALALDFICEILKKQELIFDDSYNQILAKFPENSVEKRYAEAMLDLVNANLYLYHSEDRYKVPNDKAKDSSRRWGNDH